MTRKAAHACALLGIALCASPALAQSLQQASEKIAPALKDLLAPRDGNEICFTRRYDEAHLRQHPKQKVQEMTFAVKVEHVQEDNVFRYNFTMRARIKGVRKMQETSGECGYGYGDKPSQERWIGCGVECDGGGVRVEAAPGNASLLVRLEVDGEAGRIRMAACGESEEEKSIDLVSGADDKSFRLQRADVKACQGPKR